MVTGVWDEWRGWDWRLLLSYEIFSSCMICLRSNNKRASILGTCER